MTSRRLTRAGSVLGVVALCGAVAPAAVAAPVVQDRKTVLVTLDPTGVVQPSQSRVVDQVQVAGNGAYSVTDPTAGTSVHNLDGFGGVPLTSQGATYVGTASGSTDRRTVAMLAGRLPVTVAVTYRLNGSPVSPTALLGRSGHLAVTYTVVNTTSEPTVIHYKDGFGHEVTSTVDLVTPFVGQAQVDLPAAFAAVSSARADAAGDGHGGQVLTWTMVLFSPIGQTTQRLSYQADVTDLQALPSTTIQILPVQPDRHPELHGGAVAFAGGAATGAKLTQGASQLNAGVVKLENAASLVLGGLDKLAANVDASAVNPDTLVNGLEKLKAGVAPSSTNPNTLMNGLSQFTDPNTGFPHAIAGLKLLEALLWYGVVVGDDQAIESELTMDLAQLNNDVLPALTAACGGTPSHACQKAVDDVNNMTSSTRLQYALSVAQASDLYVGHPINAPCPKVIPANALDAEQGLFYLVCGVQKALAGVGSTSTPNTLLWGAQQIVNGLGDPTTPKTLINGAYQIAAGLGSPTTPNTLIWGLTQMSAGLHLAQHKGTGVLVTQGNQTTKTFAEQYAEITAMDQKAAALQYPAPAPQGANYAVAFVYTVNGVNSDGRASAARTIVALVLLVGGAGLVSMLRRRRSRAAAAPAA